MGAALRLLVTLSGHSLNYADQRVGTENQGFAYPTYGRLVRSSRLTFRPDQFPGGGSKLRPGSREPVLHPLNSWPSQVLSINQTSDAFDHVRESDVTLAPAQALTVQSRADDPSVFLK